MVLSNSLAEIGTGLLCALLFISVSWLINRRLAGDGFHIDSYRLVLYAVTVFSLAITGEVTVNNLYRYFVGESLWQYQVMPAYGHNLSLLAPLLWPAYGIHLYFVEQSLHQRLPRLLRTPQGHALLHGLDAPLVFEVSGNLIFLLLTGSYYAYYLPGDLFHLTSLRVVPLYMVCIFFGLLLLRRLERGPRRWRIPAAIFSLGMGFLLLPALFADN